MSVPVVIFGFDRPDYVDILCRGLRAQRPAAPDDRLVHLVQDGAESCRTGRRYGDPARIADSVAAFRRHFPGGTVHRSRFNLGIAENILRGQRLAFETLGAETAYFFEDDLELGPHYVAALEALRDRTEPHASRIGYFSAYGNHRISAAGPAVRYRQLHHHWGFGLRRTAWRRIQGWLAPWWELARETDYPARDHLRILDLWRELPIASPGTSQDAAAELACVSLGLARINTDVCFARYVGAEGQSFTPESWRSEGFEAMRIAAGDAFAFPALATDVLDGIVDNARWGAEKFRRDDLRPLLDRLVIARADPGRPATPREVRALFRSLVGGEFPEALKPQARPASLPEWRMIILDRPP